MRGSESGGSDKQNVVPTQIFTYLNVISSQHKFKKPVSHDTLSSLHNLSHETNGSNNEHANFLYIYFWFSYHVLVSPFRFRKVGPGKFEIHKWIPQQVLCAISHVLCMLRLATTLRNSVKGIKTNDPISFFLMFCECSSFIFKLLMFIGLWRKGKVYQRLITFLNNQHILPYNPFKMESMTFIIAMCSTYTLLSFLRLCFGSGIVHFVDWSPGWIYRRFVAEARYTFFLDNAKNMTSAPTFDEITFFDGVIALIQILSVQARFNVGFYVDLCILFHVWTLWAPTVAFANSLYSQNPVVNGKVGLPFDLGSSVKVELGSVIHQFTALKNLSILIGQTVGDVMLPYIGEALFYYAIYFDSLLMEEDVVTRLVLMFFYMSAISILMFGAEIVRKLRWLKYWLNDSDRLALIDQNQFAMMLDDLAHNHVGITASGIFTINYSFVGTVVSILITYFIIRLQTTPG